MRHRRLTGKQRFPILKRDNGEYGVFDREGNVTRGGEGAGEYVKRDGRDSWNKAAAKSVQVACIRAEKAGDL